MVRLVTFNTTHTIICDVEKATGGIYISKPVQVIGGTQPGSLSFVPFLDYSKDWGNGIFIESDRILCNTEPVVDLLNEYNRIFGSGIEIVSSL